MARPSPRQAHDRFPYSAIVDRPPLRWPNGARVARLGHPEYRAFPVRPAVDPDHRHATLRLVPDVLNYSWRDYGVRVGIWRMMEVMEKHGVQGHGRAQLRRLPALSAHHRGRQQARLGVDGPRRSPIRSCSTSSPKTEERALIREVITTIAASTGTAPRGWLSPALSETVPHARSPGRGRHRIRRQLGQRRAALSDAGEEGLDDLHALFGRDQRHSGLARPAPEPGGVRPA